MDLKEKLKSNGQSLKWFYDSYIKDSTGLTYSYFMSQLNGFAPLSDKVKSIIEANLDMETTANDNRL